MASPGDHGQVRRLVLLLCAAVLPIAAAPVSNADVPWFARSVGNATQVISVVGDGGSSAKIDVWQRSSAGWQPVAMGIPTFVGANGMAPQTHDGEIKTPMGILTLDFTLGTAASPGGGLQ